MWNIPFSGLSVALGGVTTDVIKDTPPLCTLADNIMRDTIRLANDDILYKLGPEKGAKYVLDPVQVRQYCWDLTDNMGSYKTSTAIDLATNSEMEIEYMFSNVLDCAIYHSNRHTGTDHIGQNYDPLFTWNAYPYVESVIRSVQGVAVIAALKRRGNVPWTPSLFGDI